MTLKDYKDVRPSKYCQTDGHAFSQQNDIYYGEPLLKIVFYTYIYKLAIPPTATRRLPNSMAAANGDAVNIPVIDISEANENAAADFVDAATKYGFVFVKNNAAGIAPDEIRRTFALVHFMFSYDRLSVFFSLSHSRKHSSNLLWKSKRHVL